MSCTNTDLYKSLKKCPGERVTPGIRPSIFFILGSQILAWPTLPDALGNNASDMSELAEYSGKFTLAADAGFHRLDLVDLKSGLTWDTQGEAPSATILNKGELVVGGTGAEIKAFASRAINDSLVYLVQERSGKFVVIGSQAFDTKTTVTGDTGKGITDAAQVTIAIECPDFVPLPYYPGEIVTDQADGSSGLVKISGTDGSVITT